MSKEEDDCSGQVTGWFKESHDWSAGGCLAVTWRSFFALALS